MKLKTFLLLFFFIVSFSFAEKTSLSNVKFEVLRHYDQKELDILLQQQEYPKEFVINLENKRIIVHSDKNYNTLLALYDKDNNLQDSLAVMFMYKSANSCNMYSSEAFCLEGFSSNTPGMFFYLVYCNNESKCFSLFPINRKDLCDVYADSNAIYYSLEYENENVKRISISDKTTYSYPSSFPGGVNIFSYNAEPHFFYNEKGITTTYKIKEKVIERCTYHVKEIPKYEIIFSN